MECLLALCLQLAAGWTHANPQNCGIWYLCQPDAPYTLHQDSPTYSVGVAGEHWRAGWQGLGRTETDAHVPPPVVPVPEFFRTIGKNRGFYVEGVYRKGPFDFEGGLWLYRSTVAVAVNDYRFNSGANSVGPIAGASYNVGPFALALTVRGTESRATDWNGNHQPSPTKGFASTLEVRYTL